MAQSGPAAINVFGRTLFATERTICMKAFRSANTKICGVAEQLSPWIRAPDSKRENDVYASMVVLPGEQKRRSAFVKVFPPHIRAQRVYNEVIAHHLAIQCALPSPFTFTCACHVSLLRRGTLDRMCPDRTSQFVLGVASIEGNNTAIRQGGGDFAAKWADLMNWPHIANVAVFDELLANDDRHIPNLIRCGPHEYSLIDNERILFGEQWFDRDLDGLVIRRCDANVIADTIAEGSDEIMRRRMLILAQGYVMQISLKAPAIHPGLESICNAPADTTKRLIEMLNQRRLHLQSLMQWHMQKGDLFQVSSN